jgi:hypothetical protein
MRIEKHFLNYGIIIRDSRWKTSHMALTSLRFKILSLVIPWNNLTVIIFALIFLVLLSTTSTIRPMIHWILAFLPWDVTLQIGYHHHHLRYLGRVTISATHHRLLMKTMNLRRIVWGLNTLSSSICYSGKTVKSYLCNRLLIIQDPVAFQTRQRLPIVEDVKKVSCVFNSCTIS